MPFKIGALLDQGDNEDGYDPVTAEDSEEEEDITLKSDDHILLAGSDGQDGTASVEVQKSEEKFTLSKGLWTSPRIQNYALKGPKTDIE